MRLQHSEVTSLTLQELMQVPHPFLGDDTMRSLQRSEAGCHVIALP